MGSTLQLLKSGSLVYPTRDAFGRLTVGLQYVLGQAIREFYAGMLHRDLKAGQNHLTASYLESDLYPSEDVFQEYLEPRMEGLPVLHPLEPTLSNSPFQRLGNPPAVPRHLISAGRLLTPTFGAIAKRNLFARLAGLMERAESKLVDVQKLSYAGSEDWIYLSDVDEHLVWVRLVRLSLLMSMVRAMDYRSFWQEIDGDAGWLMSQRVKELAVWLSQTGIFPDALQLCSSPSDWFASLPLFSAFRDWVKGFPLVQLEGDRWQNWTRSHSGSVADLGSKYPFPFNPAPQDLGGPGVLGPQMFARQKAWERVSFIQQFWEHARRQFKFSHDRYRLMVTAASLQHGGKNQPHQEHRDGSEVDADLTCLPDLVPPKPTLVRFNLLTTETEIVDGHDDDPGEFDQYYLLPGDWEFPKSDEDWRAMTKKFVACQYPKSLIPAVARKLQLEWQDVALKFTECIYLVFPASIIFASNNISVQAHANLLNRVERLLANSDYAAWADSLSLIAKLLKTIRPVVWQRKSEADAFKIRWTHRNHWHINLNPDRLGSEGGFAPQGTQAEAIDLVLAQMLESGLWTELLKS